MATRRTPTPLLASAAMRRLQEDFPQARCASDHGLGWILEALERDSGYEHRQMFGCDAAYLDGLLYLVTACKREPWNGLLVCTSRDRQPALGAEWPALAPHRVLGTWLYVSQDDGAFEPTAHALVRRALARDARIGVAPKPRKRRAKRAKRKT